MILQIPKYQRAVKNILDQCRLNAAFTSLREPGEESKPMPLMRPGFCWPKMRRLRPGVTSSQAPPSAVSWRPVSQLHRKYGGDPVGMQN